MTQKVGKVNVTLTMQNVSQMLQRKCDAIPNKDDTFNEAVTLMIQNIIPSL